MAVEWNEASLSDLYDISSGLSKPASEFGSGWPFLSFKDVFYNYFVPEQLTDLVQSSLKEQVKCSVKRGDVFLTRTSETMHELGMSCVALKDLEKATFNGFTKRLRPKKTDTLVPEYVGYYLRSQQFRNEMLAFSTMSTRASLNNSMISHLSISYPDLRTQQKIAEVLKALDEKIEINRKVNETLRATAQAIFKSWFIDFDGHDDLVDSELGMIPRGWAVGAVSDVAGLNPEVWQKKFAPDQVLYLDLKNVKWGNVGDPVEYQFFEAPSRARRILRHGDTIVGTVRPANGSYGLIQDPPAFLTGSTGFAALRPKSAHYGYFNYLWLTRPSFIEYLATVAHGSAYPAVSPDLIHQAAMVVPQEQAVQRFDALISPIFMRQHANHEESRTLTELRDTLLPKLISGQLSIPDAKK